MLQYGLLGNPIQHSLSPQIHYTFARQLNHTINYQLYELEQNAIKDFLQEFATYGHGLNITTPFKDEATSFVETNCSNINVIVNNSKLFGFCVDGLGFAQVIKNLNWSIHNKNILIIGAGNAAYSIANELIKMRPAKITIGARSTKKAKIKLKAIKKSLCFNQLSALDESFDFIFQASSAGLHGNPITFNPDWIKKTSIIMDLNYNEKADAFLEQVKKQSPKLAINGLHLLIEQAAYSYKLWTKTHPNTACFYDRSCPEKTTLTPS